MGLRLFFILLSITLLTSPVVAEPGSDPATKIGTLDIGELIRETDPYDNIRKKKLEKEKKISKKLKKPKKPKKSKKPKKEKGKKKDKKKGKKSSILSSGSEPIRIQSSAIQSSGGQETGSVLRSSVGLGANPFLFDDVDVMKGRLFFTETDLHINGRNGLDLVISRHYDASRFLERGGIDVPSANPNMSWSPVRVAGNVNDGLDMDGLGVVIFDINGDGVKDMLEFHTGERLAYYDIGWGLQRDGQVSSWTRSLTTNEETHLHLEGAGVTAYDIDGNGRKEVIFYHIDDPSGANVLYYKIGWNIRTNGTFESWGAFQTINMPVWSDSHGAGITAADVNNNGQVDLIVSHSSDAYGRQNKGFRSYMMVAWDLNSQGVHSRVSSQIPIRYGYHSYGAGLSSGYIDDNALLDIVAFGVDHDGTPFYKIGWDLNAQGDIRGWSKEYKITSANLGLRGGSGARNSKSLAQYYNDNSLSWASVYDASTTGGYRSGGTGIDVTDLNGDGIPELVIAINDLTDRTIKYQVGPLYYDTPSGPNWGGWMGHGWRSSIGMRAVRVTHGNQKRIVIDGPSGTVRLDANDSGVYESSIPGIHVTIQEHTDQIIQRDTKGTRYFFTERGYTETIPDGSDTYTVEIFYLTQVQDIMGNDLRIQYESYGPAKTTYAGVANSLIGDAKDWIDDDKQKNATATYYRKRPTHVSDTFGRQAHFLFGGARGAHVTNPHELLTGIRYTNHAGNPITITYGYSSSGLLNSVQAGSLPARTYSYTNHRPTYMNYVIQMHPDDQAFSGYAQLESIGDYDYVIWEEPAWMMMGPILNQRGLPLGSRIDYTFQDGLTVHYESLRPNHNHILSRRIQPHESHPIVTQKQIRQDDGTTDTFSFEYSQERINHNATVSKTQYTLSYIGDDMWHFNFRRATVRTPSGVADHVYHFDFGKNHYKKIEGSGLRQETFSTWNITENRPSEETHKVNGTTTLRKQYATYDTYNRPRRVIETRGNHTTTIESTFSVPDNFNLLNLMTRQHTTVQETGGTAQSRESHFVYDIRGKLLERYDGTASNKFNRATFEYDTHGRVIREHLYGGPNGQTTIATQYSFVPGSSYTITRTQGDKQNQTIHDPYIGLMTRSIGINGEQTNFTYDDYSRPLSTTHPDGSQESIQYASNLRSYTTTSEGYSVTTYLDSLGRTIYINRPNGEEDERIDYGFSNQVNRRYTGQYPGTWTQKLAFTYDAFGRELTRTSPDWGTTTTTYDDTNRVTTVTDPQSQVHRTVRDLRGQVELTQHVNSLTTVTTTYDPFGQALTSTDPRGNVHTSSYDTQGRQTRVFHSKRGQSSTLPWFDYTYFNDGTINQTTIKDRSGSVHKTLTRTFDSENRVTALREGDTVKESRTYDSGTNGRGRLSTAENDDVRTSYTYDNMGRITQESTLIKALSKTYTVGHSYNRDGSIASLTHPGGRVEAYTYNAIKRLTRQQFDGNDIATYTYNPNGTVATMQLGNNITISYTYTKDILVSRIQATTTEGTVLHNQTYTYDNAGNIIETASNDPITGDPFTKTYHYNTRNELTAVDINTSQNYYTYAYDKNGNATTFSHIAIDGPQTTQRNITTDRDELLTQTYADNRQLSFTYDPLGNQLTKTRRFADSAQPHEQLRFTYNYQGQIAAIHSSTITGTSQSTETLLANYAYNHKGERVYCNTPPAANNNRHGSGQKFFYWDGAGRIIGEGHSTLGDNTVTYLYRGNEKIAMIRPDENGDNQTFFFINNLQGTPIYIVDTAGNKVSKIKQDDWGNTGSPLVGSASEVNYTGKKQDLESNLYYFNQRYYDPEIGRFLTHDPAGQFHSPYGYAGNNPLSLVDPDGEWFLEALQAVAIAAAIAAGSSAAIQYHTQGEVNWNHVGQAAIVGGIAGGIFYAVSNFSNVSLHVGHSSASGQSQAGISVSLGGSGSAGGKLANTLSGVASAGGVAMGSEGGNSTNDLDKKTWTGDLGLSLIHPTGGTIRNDSMGKGAFGEKRNTTRFGQHTGLDLLGTKVYAPMTGNLVYYPDGYNSKVVISGYQNSSRIDILIQHMIASKEGHVLRGEEIGETIKPKNSMMLRHAHIEIHYYSPLGKMYYINPGKIFTH